MLIEHQYRVVGKFDFALKLDQKVTKKVKMSEQDSIHARFSLCEGI